MKLKSMEVRVKTLGIKLAEWALLIVLATFSAALYEGMQNLKDQPAVHAPASAPAQLPGRTT